MRYSTH